MRPLRTVYAFLLEKGAAHLLDDELVPVATMEILAEGKPRALVQREIKEKERAREAVARKYARGDLSEDGESARQPGRLERESSSPLPGSLRRGKG